ncbi:hypothetical protein C884_00760 [Kocuria palustris PEL]|uniref:Uncharacterized protein n=1 Tax=Kocuria palustris PEL TaxID=1236550 RepID=M2WBZ9_9MICC|nr:hypothetical protein C884_00760 [Kocuria palustris PEL]
MHAGSLLVRVQDRCSPPTLDKMAGGAAAPGPRRPPPL